MRTRGRSLPKAPSIWIGGDCHVGNLGPIAAKDGDIAIALRDLDQTVTGSPAHDVVRLSLSMAMAVRASALPGAVTGRVLESIANGYEVALEARASRREFVLDAPPAQVLSVLRQARSRSRGQLFAERIGKDAGVIPMGKRFWPLTNTERGGARNDPDAVSRSEAPVAPLVASCALTLRFPKPCSDGSCASAPSVSLPIL